MVDIDPFATGSLPGKLAVRFQGEGEGVKILRWAEGGKRHTAGSGVVSPVGAGAAASAAYSSARQDRVENECRSLSKRT